MSHLRPIAPLPGANNESMSRNRSEVYAASCNPPRQAKRARTSPSLSPMMGPSVKSPSKSGLASPPSPVVEDAAAAPKRRGRKSSSSSRAAREAQRKMNHSIIEKARRTKINDALTTLRTLVPAQPRRTEADDDDFDAAENGGGKEEKEFKLDVLVRTVTYLQELTERVRVLEKGQARCSSCATEPGLKRKRDEVEEDEQPEGAERTSPSAARHGSAQASPPTPTTRLPSIASWLPHPMIDPSLLHKPPPDAPGATQLPSPPSSTSFHPTVSTQVPPAFKLPSASQALPPGAGAGTSPTVSPTRTPEDESMASLLLQIGASASRRSAGRAEAKQAEIQPWTPGSMLGLTKT